MEQISYYDSVLKHSGHDVLEDGLRVGCLRAMAQKLDGSVLENDVAMQEIVDEVNAMRREKDRRQNGV